MPEPTLTKTSTLPIALALPGRGSRQRQRALHQQLRAAIVDGRLAPGLCLPGSRALASACTVSRNCAVAVYERLRAEGYVETRPGGGTFVAGLAARRQPARRGGPLRTESPLELARALAPAWRGVPPLMGFAPASGSGAVEFDFAPGLPDASAFPFDAWRRLSARALRALARRPAAYAEPAGRWALRAAIARHLSLMRAVACEADDVLVSSGAQQAFDLLARIFVQPGKTVVALEEPGYPPLRWAFEAAGATVAPVTVDAEGIVVAQIPPQARVVCVSPSHQFPMGPALSPARRLQLLDFARSHGAVIVEDDYDGEFVATERPLDALQTLDRAQRVFYVGTFSKSLFPALRLGFVVAPPWARPALLAAKQRADWHGAVLAQDTLAAFIAEGHLARHGRRMRVQYGERRHALQEALQERLPQALHVLPASGGLHLASLLRARRGAEAIAAAAAEDGVRVAPIARYALRREDAPEGLVFGLGGVAPARIEAAVQRLARHVLAR